MGGREEKEENEDVDDDEEEEITQNTVISLTYDSDFQQYVHQIKVRDTGLKTTGATGKISPRDSSIAKLTTVKRDGHDQAEVARSEGEDVRPRSLQALQQAQSYHISHRKFQQKPIVYPISLMDNYNTYSESRQNLNTSQKMLNNLAQFVSKHKPKRQLHQNSSLFSGAATALNSINSTTRGTTEMRVKK